MKYLLTLVIYALIVCALRAQNTVKFHGIITDTTTNPIELVNVVAQEVETQNIVSFGVSNEKGEFVLKLVEGKQYEFKASFVGYHELTTNILGGDNAGDPEVFTLTPSITELAAMEIVYEFPVVVHGDTITYKSEAFTSGQERKLEDVLNALPGFEVDENGQVKVQGKEVEKILVDGKEFFEGDTKMATQNIPADAVSKVQLLRNFNDVSPMSGLNDDEDRLALNIKLSKDMKNIVFGDIEGGLGLKDRYFGHANTFFYNKKTTINFIGDLNNIGSQAFSPRDYFRFSGGFGQMSGHSGSSISMREDDFGFSFLENNNAQKMSSKVGAVNFNYVPNKDWNFSGFAIFSHSNIDISSFSKRTYINTEEENTEVLESDETRASFSTLAKLKAIFTPHDDLYISYEGFLKGAELDKKSFLSIINNRNENEIDNRQIQEPINISQKVSAFYTLNTKNIFSFEGSYVYKWQKPHTNISASSPLFTDVFPTDGSDNFALNQNVETSLHQQNAISSWYHIINKTNHLAISIGNSISFQSLNSENFQNNESLLLTNDQKLTFTDFFFGAGFTSKFGKLIFKPALKIHRYDFVSTIGEENNVIEKPMLDPSMSISYKILSSQTLSFRYSMNNTFSDIQKLTRHLVLRSYNSLYQGNEALHYSQSNVFNLNYYNFSMYSNLNLYGGLTHQKRKRDFVDSQLYDGLERTSSTINASQPSRLNTAYAGFTKTFTKYKLSGQINISNSQTYNRINDLPNENNNFNQRYRVSGETNLFTKLTISLSHERAFNRYTSLQLSRRFETTTSIAKLSLMVTKSLDLVLDYAFNKFNSNTGNSHSKYDFLDTRITFQPEKSAIQINLSLTNLLNTTFIRRDSFTESLIDNYTYFVQPRFSMLTVKYEL